MTDTPSTPPEGTPTGPVTPPPGSTGTPGTYSSGGGLMDATVYAGPPATQDDKTMAMLAHLLGILTGFVGPLIIWLIKKDQSPFVNDQGKEALNFHLTLLIGWLIGAVANMAFCVGILIWLAVWVCSLVFGIMAAMKAKDGIAYRYPFALRLVK